MIRYTVVRSLVLPWNAAWRCASISLHDRRIHRRERCGNERIFVNVRKCPEKQIKKTGAGIGCRISVTIVRVQGNCCREMPITQIPGRQYFAHKCVHLRGINATNSFRSKHLWEDVRLQRSSVRERRSPKYSPYTLHSSPAKSLKFFRKTSF